MAASIRAEMVPAMRNATNAAVLQGSHGRPAATESPHEHSEWKPGRHPDRVVCRTGGRRGAGGSGRARIPGQPAHGGSSRASYELLAGVQQTRASAIVEVAPGVLVPDRMRRGHCLAVAAPANAWSAFLEGGGRAGLVRASPAAPAIALRSSRSPCVSGPTPSPPAPATLTICDEHGVAVPRAIVISQSGRARLRAAPPADCR